MRLLTLVVIFASFYMAFCEKARFDNYRVYSMIVENEEQLRILQELENHRDGIEFLESPNSIGDFTELIVPPHKLADINDLFEKYEIKSLAKSNNLQKLIDEEQPQFSSRATFSWEKYYDLDDIYKWLDEMLEEYPNELTNYNYGTSYENRPLRAIKFSRKSGNPLIFIESTIHAREWVTAATATYILNELVTSDDPEIKELADNYDWVIIPVFNVDGYSYTHSKNRLWRKSRSSNGLYPFCVGTDLNRNFDFHHAEAGASRNPCYETYAGTKPFSEKETQALAEFVSNFDNIKMYISFHSYGQMLLFPYGHTKSHAKNFHDMNAIGLKAKEGIKKRYGTNYIVGSIAEAIYLASGSSIDWAYAQRNVSLTYSFEFRDARNGNYGFILPANFIIPNAVEVLDGLKAMTKQAKSLKYF
ncbi:zinc carboxypeptidase-like [Contarinia nasturtii]|uniref:zinc carboxypeptidase-like n=1 Tax=Contarinia nasturtii TaxID=265458 RepID=UPI0012D452D6|nr:zinc carboxypeptidase-like [Contarinia nasturtii]